MIPIPRESHNQAEFRVIHRHCVTYAQITFQTQWDFISIFQSSCSSWRFWHSPESFRLFSEIACESVQNAHKNIRRFWKVCPFDGKLHTWSDEKLIGLSVTKICESWKYSLKSFALCLPQEYVALVIRSFGLLCLFSQLVPEIVWMHYGDNLLVIWISDVISFVHFWTIFTLGTFDDVCCTKHSTRKCLVLCRFVGSFPNEVFA